MAGSVVMDKTITASNSDFMKKCCGDLRIYRGSSGPNVNSPLRKAVKDSQKSDKLTERTLLEIDTQSYSRKFAQSCHSF